MLRFSFQTVFVSFLLILTSCFQKNDPSPASDNLNVRMFINLIRNDQEPELFQKFVKICENYGTVKILEENDTNKSQVFIAFDLHQLQEGSLPNFGKQLPVYKVSILVKGCDTIATSNLNMQDQEYIGISDDTEENEKKIIASFKHMLDEFNTFYKKNTPSDRKIIFFINNY